MNYNDLLKQVNEFIVSFFTLKTDSRLLFHNHLHTWQLVDTVNKITTRIKVGDRAGFILLSAAWFYDTGYFTDDLTGSYEQRSAVQAEFFLQSLGVDVATINEVKNCILNTAVGKEPETETEQIFSDVLYYYWGTNEFVDKNRLLRTETEALNNTKIPGADWRKGYIEQMEKHRYYTSYCQSKLMGGKIENINRLKRKQEIKQLEEVKQTLLLQSDNGEKSMKLQADESVSGKKNDKKEKDERRRPERGIETLFRVASANHQRLSAMADNKAHIMISVNSIIISAILALVIRNLDAMPYLIVPTIILLIVSVSTIIFSILATRPRLPNGYFTREQITNKDVDLSFFGNYYKMDFKDYDAGMKELMKDREFLYGSLIRNLYGQAKVLGKKFKLLRISYDIFMFGIVISVLVYILSLLMNK